MTRIAIRAGRLEALLPPGKRVPYLLAFEVAVARFAASLDQRYKSAFVDATTGRASIELGCVLADFDDQASLSARFVESFADALGASDGGLAKLALRVRSTPAHTWAKVTAIRGTT